jgi:hypothetical protein
MTPSDVTILVAAGGIGVTIIISIMSGMSRRIRQLTDAQTVEIKEAISGVKQDVRQLDSKVVKLENRVVSLEAMRARLARKEILARRDLDQRYREGTGSSG